MRKLRLVVVAVMDDVPVAAFGDLAVGVAASWEPGRALCEGDEDSDPVVAPEEAVLTAAETALARAPDPAQRLVPCGNPTLRRLAHVQEPRP